MAELSDKSRTLLSRPVIVAVTTLNPDGSPQTTPVWATLDGDDVLMSTVEGRRKHRNLVRDPRASVMAYDPDSPLSYVSIEGSVTMTTVGGPELIQALSQLYVGASYTGDEGTDHVRVVVRLTPRKVLGQ